MNAYHQIHEAVRIAEAQRPSETACLGRGWLIDDLLGDHALTPLGSGDEVDSDPMATVIGDLW